MQFIDAKNKLKDLAMGEYHSIAFKMTESKAGELETECSVYIDGMPWISGSNFKDALAKMEIALKGKSIEEMPAIEA